MQETSFYSAPPHSWALLQRAMNSMTSGCSAKGVLELLPVESGKDQKVIHSTLCRFTKLNLGGYGGGFPESTASGIGDRETIFRRFRLRIREDK